MTSRKNPLFAVGDEPDERTEHRAAADLSCPGCPVSMVMDTFVAAQPEALDHLLAAASETLAALQVVLDSAQLTIEAHRAALHVRASADPQESRPAPESEPQRKPPRPAPPRGRRSAPRVQHIDLG